MPVTSEMKRSQSRLPVVAEMEKQMTKHPENEKDIRERILASLARFPDPMRTPHIAKALDLSEHKVERMRSETRATGVRHGPPWIEVTPRHVIYPKALVADYMVSQLVMAG